MIIPSLHVRLRWKNSTALTKPINLNPFPKNFEALLRSYDRVLVPEMNLGQLSSIVRDKFLLDVVPLNKIQGQPFKVGEVRDAIDQLLEA